MSYPPRPAYGDWLPIDAINAVSDLHRDAKPEARKLIERVAVSEIAAPAAIKLSRRLDYLGWSLLLSTMIDAAFMPFDEMHRALSEANGLRDDIVKKSLELADLLDKYRETCLNGMVDSSFDASGLCIGETPWTALEFREQLRDMASHMQITDHIRYGVGKAAWSKRTQKTSDGLPQFVRYFDDRMRALSEAGTSTGGLGILTPTLFARLAIPALNIKGSRDDVLGETVTRIIDARK